MSRAQPWADKAAASDQEVLDYTGLTKDHIAMLKAACVDVSTYLTLKAKNSSQNSRSKASTVSETKLQFIAEKRKLLQALATRAATKVRKGLQAAQASHAAALQENQDDTRSLQRWKQPCKG